MKVASRWTIANIASDDALILPHRANPDGLDFRERQPWKRSDHSRLFKRAAIRAGLDPAEVTIYALRHSSIVRQILGGVPIRVIAVNHDTSVGIIERTYSKYIADHADALARAALLDTTPKPPMDNVVSIATAR